MVKKARKHIKSMRSEIYSTSTPKLWDGRGKIWDLISWPCHYFWLPMESRLEIHPTLSVRMVSNLWWLRFLSASHRQEYLVFWLSRSQLLVLDSFSRSNSHSTKVPATQGVLQEVGQKFVPTGKTTLPFHSKGATSLGWAAHLIQTLKHKSLFTFIALIIGGLFTSREFLNSYSLMGEKESLCLDDKNCSQGWHGGFLSSLSTE